MNRIYKSVWDPNLGEYRVASELAKGRKKSKVMSLLVAIGTGAFVYSAHISAETINYTGSETLKIISDPNNYMGEIYPDATILGPEENVNLSGNKVTVDFETNSTANSKPDVVYGALTSVSEDGKVSNNEINLNSGQINDSVYGGMIYSITGSEANVIAENNQVQLNAGFGSVQSIYGGRAVALGSSDASVFNNKIEVNSYSGYNSVIFAAGEVISMGGNAYASGNSVTINDTRIDGSEFGSENTTISAVNVDAKKESYVTHNSLTINNSHFIDAGKVINAVEVNTLDEQIAQQNERYMPDGDISYNQLIINQSSFRGSDSSPEIEFYTVNSEGKRKQITYNTAAFNDNNLTDMSISTVLSRNGLVDEVSNNELKINHSELNNTELSTVISKGYSRKILNNKLSIESSTINNSPDVIGVYVGNNADGELAGSTRIEGNSVTIKNSIINNSDINAVAISKKGYAYDVKNNSIDIIDSAFIGNSIIAPVYYVATVDTSSTDEGESKVSISGNTVRISGNTTFDNTGTKKIYASYLDLTNSPELANGTLATHYAMNDNKVIIDGVSDLSTVDLYGSEIKKAPAGITRTGLSSLNSTTENIAAENRYNIIAGNTLEVHSYSDTVKLNSATNFAKYQFYIEGEAMINEPLLTTNEAIALDYQDANGTYQSVGLGITINGNASLSKGDTVAPFSNATETNLTDYQDGKAIKIQKGAGGYYDAVITLQNGEAVTEVTSNVKVNEQSKALLEGQSASLAFVNQGADLIVGKGISNALQFSGHNEGNAAGFGSISVGSSRYKTGSHVDVDGTSLLVGSAIKNGNLLLGTFFEAGWGDYDSRNSFASGSVHGDGNTQYRGGGLMSRYDLTDSLYIDGSLRLGKTKVDFSTNDIQINNSKVSYESNSLYYGAHLGLGYAMNVDEKQSIEFRSNYIWTHQEGDDITTNTDRYEFDSSNSHRIQAIAQYSYKLDNGITPYVGLGYEYEFDGKSKATISGIKTDETSLKGSTGIIELGAKSRTFAGTDLYLDINAKGYLGKREGVLGEINIIYAF